jgi:alkaline phosphatase
VDDHDLIARAISQHYQYVTTREELCAATGPQVLGLFAAEGMTTRQPEPTLAEMTARAIEFLDKDQKGFFLMVEGSQIDWANHENDADNSVRQMLSFDMAIRESIRFAEKNKKTLVVVTADHETGGLVIVDGASDGSTLTVSWSGKGHNGGTVPLYAFGPGALHFSGFHENTDMAKIIAALFKIKPFPAVRPR